MPRIPDVKTISIRSIRLTHSKRKLASFFPNRICCSCVKIQLKKIPEPLKWLTWPGLEIYLAPRFFFVPLFLVFIVFENDVERVKKPVKPKFPSKYSQSSPSRIPKPKKKNHISQFLRKSLSPPPIFYFFL